MEQTRIELAFTLFTVETRKIIDQSELIPLVMFVQLSYMKSVEGKTKSQFESEKILAVDLFMSM